MAKAKQSEESYETKTTTDQEEIRRWVEERGGHPARVEGTDLLRIDYPREQSEVSLSGKHERRRAESILEVCRKRVIKRHKYVPFVILLAEKACVFTFQSGDEAAPLVTSLRELAEIARLVSFQTSQHFVRLAGVDGFFRRHVQSFESLFLLRAFRN
jgi:hypothetical protein